MEQYKAGTTLYIDANEGCADESSWWMDPSVMKVVRHNVDTDFVLIAEREHAPPVIRSWMSPNTFEIEQRLINTWKLTYKYKNVTSTNTIDLPVNMIKYTMRDRIRKVA
jgi:hypothetical protein